MGCLIENVYSCYEMTEEEMLVGAILTNTQQQVLQNEIALVAHELLDITLDTQKLEDYYQEQAYKKGQLDALNYRLEASVAAEEELAVRRSSNVDPIA